jgi:hypothetical protein
MTDDRYRGGVAQLGEHLPCKQGVSGSSPLISTKKIKEGFLKGSNKRERRRSLKTTQRKENTTNKAESSN